MEFKAIEFHRIVAILETMPDHYYKINFQLEQIQNGLLPAVQGRLHPEKFLMSWESVDCLAL